MQTLKQYLIDYSAAVFLWSMAFLAPIKTVLIAVSVLVLIDTITGIWAAVRRKELLTSNGFRRVVSKTLGYQLAILTSLLMEKYFLEPLPVIQIVSGLIAVTEFKSILENLSSITGLDLWAAVLEKLHGNKVQPIKKANNDKE